MVFDQSQCESVSTRDYGIGFLCASASWGGLEMNVLRLALWLKDRGWKVILYGQKGTGLFENAEAGGISVRHLNSTFKYGDLVNARRLARYVKQDNVQRLIINYGKDLFLAVLAKIFSGRFFKLLMQQHLHVGGAKKDLFHTWEYRHLDAWIVPLPMFADRLKLNTRLDPAKIHIIPFGLELDRFTRRRPDRMGARRRLNLPEEAIMAGIVGRLDVKKGQDVLIRAGRLVHEAGCPLHLLIVGDRTANDPEGFFELLETLTEQLELKPFVHFRPHQADVERIYAAMDIFVLASHSETYGMVTIEAMASRCPVIGTAGGGTVQIIEDGVNGLLVPPQHDRKLAEAILKLVNDSNLAERLASQAESDAISRYSHLRQVDLLEGLFESLG
ncbi:MAG: glycosyltransferase family 4 protein [candidate division Zixibacteria bacterium]|nr:glycosyltransferase family 4 protein [candidate division Zixibacteria bacterium]